MHTGLLEAVARPAKARTRAEPRERARRQLVGVVMIVYLLLLFEGSLRKWVAPQLSLYIFFIRDPFVLYAYVLAVRYRLWPRSTPLLVVCVAMAVLGLLLGSIQLVTDDSSTTRVLLALYGWRNYFLYAPLAFLIGAQFRYEDVLRVARWTLLLSVPIAVLVTAQFFASPDSPINVGLASEAALRFVGLGVTGEHTRPMGTFSSGAGQIQFVASAFALLLGLVIAPARQRGVSLWVLLLAAGGVATCLALGGSRATLLHCGLIAVIGMGLVVIGRSTALKLRSVLLPLTLVWLFAALYPVVYPEGFAAFAARWDVAASAESKTFQGGVFGRALYGFIDFTRLWDRTPVLGYGLGLGGNASTTLGVKIDGGDPVSLAETDWARHIVDLGPVFGTGYIAFRIVLVLWLGMLVLKATRRGAGPLPLLLFAYAGYVLLLGQVTGQGAVNAYAWLFTGLCIAAARMQRDAAPALAEPAYDRLAALRERLRSAERGQAA
jgi:hypothetical protein